MSRFSKIVSTMAAAAVATTLSVGVTGGANAGLIQLGVAVDASGSIGSSNFNTVRTGIANAINAIVPTNGSVELTLVRFASYVSTIIGPTVITAANKASIVSTISSMSFTGGTTGLASAINSLTSQITGSSNFATADASIYNIVTDGFPNSQSNSIAQRNNAIGAGIDEIDIEFIGSNTAGYNFMRNSICYPLACDTTSFTPGFIVGVTFDNFQTAFENKLRFVTNQAIPEPGTLALFGLGLVGLSIARRKKAA